MSEPLPNPARDRILDAVIQLSSEQGAGNFTLEQVAQVAGISKGGLLYHFPSKEALLLALGRRFLESVETGRREALERLPDEHSSHLKASILSMLCRPESRSCQGAAVLAAAASDPALIDMFRASLATHTADLACSGGSFERKAIISLAVDGLMLREALRISPFTPEQRDAVIHALLHLADESCRLPEDAGSTAQ